jgi:hypothetical protein
MLIFLTTNLALLAVELNTFICVGSEFSFSPAIVRSLKSITHLQSNDGLELASNVISNVGFQKTYDFYGTVYTSLNVETLLKENLGFKYDIISRDFIRDRLGIQLKFVTSTKNLSSFYSIQEEMIISKKDYLPHYHVSVSAVNPSASIIADSLKTGGWSYDLMNPQITELDLENIKINKETRDDIINSIYKEFR